MMKSLRASESAAALRARILRQHNRRNFFRNSGEHLRGHKSIGAIAARAANYADRAELEVGKTKLSHRIAGALNKERRRCICPAGSFDLNLAHFVGSKDSHELNNYIALAVPIMLSKRDVSKWSQHNSPI